MGLRSAYESPLMRASSAAHRRSTTCCPHQRKDSTMRINILSIGTLGVAGLVTTGLMALPLTANAATGKDQVLKRDDDTPDVVLVTDDDDDDDGRQARDTHTNTNTDGNTG